MTPKTHHVVVVVGAPEVRTVAGAEIGSVTSWLVDPLPLEVIPEVDIELMQAAALICATETKKYRHTKCNSAPIMLCKAATQGRVMGKLQQVTTEGAASQRNDYARLPKFSPAARGSLNKTLLVCWPKI